jgi:hypothetical protein
MALRSAKLIWILCCTLAVLFTSLAGAQASSCLPSAAAVKSAYPGAWPHWTLRPHSRDGVKCWHPGTQAAAHRHQFKVVRHKTPIGAPKPITASIDNLLNWSPPAAPAETSGAGWSLQARAVTFDATSVPAQNSFTERFAAVFEVVFFESPSVVRRIEGLISNMH